jgi:hypothetical protein
MRKRLAIIGHLGHQGTDHHSPSVTCRIARISTVKHKEQTTEHCIPYLFFDAPCVTVRDRATAPKTGLAHS